MKINKALESDPNNSALLKAKSDIENKVKINKHNASRKLYKGKVYDSVREAMFARRCDEEGLQKQEQVWITVLDGFELFGEKVRPVKMRVDFIVEGYAIVDVKGVVEETFKIKWKMLKSKYRSEWEYYTPRTDDEVEEVINKLIKDLDV